MFAYVGCYTTPDRDGRGDGIRVYRLNQGGDVYLWRPQTQQVKWPGKAVAVHPGRRDRSGALIPCMAARVC